MEQREVLTVHAFSVLSSALIAKGGPWELGYNQSSSIIYFNTLRLMLRILYTSSPKQSFMYSKVVLKIVLLWHL